MNLKDRLEKDNSSNNISINKKSDLKEFELIELYSSLYQFIQQLAKHRRNVILVSDKSIDKYVVANFIKSQLSDNNARILYELDTKHDVLNGNINIFPSPDMMTIVKILEQIVYGCKSFIFGLSLGSYNNFLNKLIALIALNYRNLSHADIKTLIGATNAIVIFISTSENGLYYISKIDEIKIKQTELYLETIYQNNRENEEYALRVEKEEENKNIQNEVKEEINNEEKEEVKEEPKVETVDHKPNKYELLREKIRNKRLLAKNGQ